MSNIWTITKFTVYNVIQTFATICLSWNFVYSHFGWNIISASARSLLYAIRTIRECILCKATRTWTERNECRVFRVLLSNLDKADTKLRSNTLRTIIGILKDPCHLKSRTFIWEMFTIDFLLVMSGGWTGNSRTNYLSLSKIV